MYPLFVKEILEFKEPKSLSIEYFLNNHLPFIFFLFRDSDPEKPRIQVLK